MWEHEIIKKTKLGFVWRYPDSQCKRYLGKGRNYRFRAKPDVREIIKNPQE